MITYVPTPVDVIGQLMERVPAGDATVDPDNTKADPNVIVPPLLFRTSWFAEAPCVVKMTENATATMMVCLTGQRDLDKTLSIPLVEPCEGSDVSEPVINPLAEI